jgi:hypothetical protein
MSAKPSYVVDTIMKCIFITLLTVVVIFAMSGAAQATKVIPLPAGFNQGLGRAINESDQVVGVMWYNPGPYCAEALHPFSPFIYYNDGGTAHALAGYNPSLDYESQDLSNDANLVVGYLRDNVTPWVWDPVNQFSKTLPFDGYTGACAIEIDEADGLILGFGLKPGSTDTENIQWKLVNSDWVLTDEGEGLDRAFSRNNMNTIGHHSGSMCSTNPGWKPIIKSGMEVPEPGSCSCLTLGFLHSESTLEGG